jgi:hypothetical protein
MKAVISNSGVIVPTSHVAEIMPNGDGSRVFIGSTVGAVGNNVQDIETHYEDFSESPIVLAELLGWEIVNKTNGDK